MIVGLLALQGAFTDHISFVEGAGHTVCEVREVRELALCDALIIPGGESTVLGLYLAEFGLIEPLKKRICDGMPVWGICAGAITLSRQGPLGLMPLDVLRNAMGRQIFSTEETLQIPVLKENTFPAVFIRAPRIVKWDSDCQVLACGNKSDPVLVRRKNILVSTFHPELTRNHALHKYFFDFMSGEQR